MSESNEMSDMIQRYDLDLEWRGPDSVQPALGESDDGDVVLHADHLAALAAKDAEIADLDARLDVMAMLAAGRMENPATFKHGEPMPGMFGAMCRSMIDAFKATPEANSYLELSMVDGEDEHWTLTIQRQEGETPGSKAARLLGERDAAQARAERAEQEAAGLRADAERYRKWRHEFREGSCGLWNALCEANSDAEHDAAIDAALDAGRAGGEG